jgi:hypothetical protein
MKKIIILAIAIILGAFNANAQFGGVLGKAAKKVQQKTEDKIIEKTSEKVAEKVSDDITNSIDIPDSEPAETSEVTESDEPLTYESLMKMVPAIPSAADMVSYKKAELNGQSFKLLSSSVMKFQMSILDLTGKVYSIPYQGADSAQIVDAAYRNAELYTGLTREEIDMLATLPEEEQEAYIQAHYDEGRAEAVMLQQAAELGEEMEPLQPDIDRWSSFDDKIAENQKDCSAKCKKIYGKYADKLANAEGDDARNKVLLKYYEEVAPIIRESIVSCNKIRFEEQFPVAMEIEEQMGPIRERHQNAIAALLNYPQLTVVQYLTETLRIMEVPEYPDLEEE